MVMMMMMMMMKANKIMMVDTAGFGAADPEHADNTKKAGWENVLEPLCLDDGDHHDHEDDGTYNYDLNIMMICVSVTENHHFLQKKFIFLHPSVWLTRFILTFTYE